MELELSQDATKTKLGYSQRRSSLIYKRDHHDPSGSRDDKEAVIAMTGRSHCEECNDEAVSDALASKHQRCGGFQNTALA